MSLLNIRTSKQSKVVSGFPGVILTLIFLLLFLVVEPAQASNNYVSSPPNGTRPIKKIYPFHCLINAENSGYCWHKKIPKAFETNTLELISTVLGLCGLKTDGKIYCADREAEDGASPLQGFENIVSVNAENLATNYRNFNFCALNSSGQLKCVRKDSLSYKFNFENTPSDLGKVREYTSTRLTNCAVSLAGRPFCWDQYGEEFDPRIPTDFGKVVKLEVDIYRNSSTLYGVACATNLQNRFACWDYTSGEVYIDETVQDSIAQTLIMKSSTYSLRHVCNLYANGEIQCWGKDYEDIPPNMEKVHQLYPGKNGLNVCALQINNQVHCWGGERWVEEWAKSNLPPPSLKELGPVIDFDTNEEGKICVESNQGEEICFSAFGYDPRYMNIQESASDQPNWWDAITSCYWKDQDNNLLFQYYKTCNESIAKFWDAEDILFKNVSVVRANNSVACAINSSSQAYCHGRTRSGGRTEFRLFKKLTHVDEVHPGREFACVKYEGSKVQCANSHATIGRHSNIAKVKVYNEFYCLLSHDGDFSCHSSGRLTTGLRNTMYPFQVPYY